MYKLLIYLNIAFILFLIIACNNQTTDPTNTTFNFRDGVNSFIAHEWIISGSWGVPEDLSQFGIKHYSNKWLDSLDGIIISGLKPTNTNFYTQIDGLPCFGITAFLKKSNDSALSLDDNVSLNGVPLIKYPNAGDYFIIPRYSLYNNWFDSTHYYNQALAISITNIANSTSSENIKMPPDLYPVSLNGHSAPIDTPDSFSPIDTMVFNWGNHDSTCFVTFNIYAINSNSMMFFRTGIILPDTGSINVAPVLLSSPYVYNNDYVIVQVIRYRISDNYYATINKRIAFLEYDLAGIGCYIHK
jgi:hypothetical protein